MIEVSKKFGKKIIVVMFVTIIAFVATVVVCNINDIQVQEPLIYGFFGLFASEFGLLAWIKTKESKHEQNPS